MIDAQLFRASREAARFGLPAEAAKSSFGYYIDIPNAWETYRSPEELISFLSIHRTHAAQFAEIIEDLGAISPDERDWARRYVALYERVARLLSTAGYRNDLKHDLAETMFDWRTILRFAKLPCRVLDFGAGCARQGVSAFLRNDKNIYVAVDGTLAAYTVQNLVLSHIDTLAPEPGFSDFLDYEIAKLPFPQIKNARPGDRFHVPVWMIEKHVPERFFDVIIAAHVHNELSKNDFLRLVDAVDRGLAAEGIFYVRSEVTVNDPKDYFDSIDLHAVDLLALMLEKGLVPVCCKNESAFMTTVFARKDSSHHKAARASKAPENAFLDANISQDLSLKAADHFMERHLKGLTESGKNVVVVGEGTPWYERFIRPILKSVQSRKIYEEARLLNEVSEETAGELRSFHPDIVVIASEQYGVIEQQVRQLLPANEFPLRRHYRYPVVFLYGKSTLRRDDFLVNPILAPKDIRDR